MTSQVGRIISIVVVLVGVLVSLSAFLMLERAGEREQVELLRGRAHERLLEIERTIQADLALLRAFRGLFEAAAGVDREAFHHFRKAIRLPPGVYALSWAPRVTAAEREGFEALARVHRSADFRIWQPGGDARSVPAGPRREYFPVLYNERAEPAQSRIVGFDVASDLMRRRAIEAARLTGELVATPPIHLMNTPEGGPNGFLVVAPVYAGRELPPLMERLGRTRGVVVAVFEISQLFREAIGAETPSALHVQVFDRTDGDRARLILAGEADQAGAAGAGSEALVLAQRMFDIAGRKWEVIVSTGRVPGRFGGWAPWLAALVGMLLTAALGTVLHLAQGRQAYAESVAERRTEELVRIADRLNAEVSERRSIETQLLRSRGRLRDSIESLDDGFALYDAEHKLVLWNSKYRDFDRQISDRLTRGVSFAELARAGQDACQWKQPLDPASCSPAVLRVPSSSERQLCDGRWLLVKLQPTSEGGLVDIRTDITHLKARAAELEDHRDRLEELVAERTRTLEEQAVKLLDALEKEREYNALQGEFVSMVSHEFRTPLAIIDGAAQRIHRKAEGLAPDDLRARIGKIRNAVRRLVSLIESTLSFSRIEAGKIEIDPRDMDLRALLMELCDQQQQLAEGHTIVCQVDGLPARIAADQELLRLIFSNLLSNAVKYSPGADRVEVKGRVGDDGDLRITVRDFGLGIPEDDLPRLFDRFYRATNVTGIAGTGIGLNLSRSLAELHGGTITVQSVQGEGSLFTVRLPPSAAQDLTGDLDRGLSPAQAASGS